MEDPVYFSDLKHMAASPAHYQYAVEHRSEPTRAMVVGSVTDAIVFGAAGKVHVYKGRRTGGDWVSFREACPAGSIICSEAEYADAKGAADAVLADHIARAMIVGSHVRYQVPAQWRAYELECATRGFDVLCERDGYILDLKATTDSSPEALQRHVLRMFWHCQGHWYLEGARAQGMDVTRFYLCCVESTPPHPVTVVDLSPAYLRLAEKTLVRWTERLRGCIEANAWPGYVQTVTELEPPIWLAEEENDA
jgi:hypothetical protein